MSNQKTIESFVNHIDTLIADLLAAGFEQTHNNVDKSFVLISDPAHTDGFCNITSTADNVFSILFPNFTSAEVKQFSSFLIFMANVFSDERYSVHSKLNFSVTFGTNEFSLVSEIFCLEIKDSSLVIRGSNLTHTFIRPLDTEFHDFMYSLKKSFKRNVNIYFEDVVEIDNSIIKTILNENVDDYFWRKNDCPSLNRISDADFIRSVVEFGKNNVVRSKVPSLDIHSQNHYMTIKKMYNNDYAAEIERGLISDHVIEIRFIYNELRHIKPLLKSVINEKDLNFIFQIMELYIFKLKIENKITDLDLVTVLRNHINTLEKQSLLNHCYLKISLLDLHISFSDVIELEERVFRSHKTTKLRSDSFETLHDNYKEQIISSIEKIMGLPANEICNDSLLVHQMVII